MLIHIYHLAVWHNHYLTDKEKPTFQLHNHRLPGIQTPPNCYTTNTFLLCNPHFIDPIFTVQTLFNGAVIIFFFFSLIRLLTFFILEYMITATSIFFPVRFSITDKVKTTYYKRITRHKSILIRKNNSLLSKFVVITVRYNTIGPKNVIHPQDFDSVPEVRVITACTAGQTPTPATLA